MFCDPTPKKNKSVKDPTRPVFRYLWVDPRLCICEPDFLVPVDPIDLTLKKLFEIKLFAYR